MHGNVCIQDGVCIIFENESESESEAKEIIVSGEEFPESQIQGIFFLLSFGEIIQEAHRNPIQLLYYFTDKKKI